MNWDLSPPQISELIDRDVDSKGRHLKGKRIALLITGSIAAYRTPDLVRELRREGAEVVAYVSKESLKYVTRDTLEWATLNPVIENLTSKSEHLSDSEPFDAYLVAPATYNVINKTAQGIADNVITSTLASAIGKLEREKKPILIAPAMHGSMHNTILIESMLRLQKLGVTMIPPRQENGKNNLSSLSVIVASTIRSLSQSNLRDKRFLITGGPTPVYLDSIRCITNHFTGSLAIEIAKEAFYRGINVKLILGRGSIDPPDFINREIISTYDEYVEKVEELIKKEKTDLGIFTAAVADYRPEQRYEGKITSELTEQNIKFIPTEKVIKKIRKKFPHLYMVTFKYEEEITHNELIKIANNRIQFGYQLIVANRGNEKGSNNEQIAWLVQKYVKAEKATGKPEIAEAILNRLEKEFSREGV